MLFADYVSECAPALEVVEAAHVVLAVALLGGVPELVQLREEPSAPHGLEVYTLLLPPVPPFTTHFGAF